MVSQREKEELVDEIMTRFQAATGASKASIKDIEKEIAKHERDKRKTAKSKDSKTQAAIDPEELEWKQRVEQQR